MVRAVLGLFGCCLAYGQTPDPSLSFEVASVKPSPPPEAAQGGVRRAMRMGCSGGPGTPSPGQYTCANATVAMMVRDAFGLQPYQLPSVSMTDGPRYEVTAKIPAGATREQIRTMMQNLLTERFKLTYHHEKKEMQLYDLVVGKNGLKLKESPPETPPPADGAQTAALPPPPAPGRITMGSDGFPVMPSRRGSMSMAMMSNGGIRMSASDSTVEQIVGILSNQLGRPVTDATGLKGKYDFTLTFTGDVPGGRGPSMSVSMDGGPAPAPPPESDAPTIFAAVQQQLGLKLEAKKGDVDIFVIEHVEKNPTEN